MAADPREIKAVAYVLQLDHDGKSVDEVAEECIKALRTLEGTATRTAMGEWKVGDTFRTPAHSSPLIVAYKGKTSWLVGKADTYGVMAHHYQELWRWREPARITDGVKAKALTNVDGHRAGDMFINSGSVSTVVAVCMNGVLLENEHGFIPESNEYLKRFYAKVD